MKPSVQVVLLSAAVLVSSFWAFAQQDLQKPVVSPEQQKRLELMKSKRTEASLTILPIRLAG